MLLCVTVDEHNRRVTELLEANNREVERRRAAEAEAERLRAILRRIGEMASAESNGSGKLLFSGTVTPTVDTSLPITKLGP